VQEDFSTTYPSSVGIPADTSLVRFNLAVVLDEPVEVQEVLRATISSPAYGSIGTATADATITDNSNNPPVAVTDSASTQEDIAIVIDVLDNDSDPDDDDLTITTAGANGSEGTTENGGMVSINNNGTPEDPTDDFIDYTPPAGFAGFDVFTYSITDGDETATANVVVGVDMNNPPVAVNDTTSVPGSGSLDIEVLINDSDPDGDDITINFIETANGGTVSTDGTTISYAPPMDYCGVDTITYEICDYGPLCDQAIVLVTVIPDDTDGDGIFDFLETTILDSDEDGTPNYQDLDSDNDGIPDSEEVEFIDACTIEFPDSDNDGEEDYTDADIVVYDSFTPDGDGINDTWVIEDIESFPDNTVKLFNRWGNLIYEETGYNNSTRSWDASRTNGVGFGTDRVPDGTYFYVIDLGNGSRARSGYVVIKR
ncbi:MAG: Ig-like domain-containing protein, partial [Bacteroidota bacterium]